MKVRGMDDMMGHVSSGGAPYDVKGNAERIANINNWIERRKALECIPRQHAYAVNAEVQQRFRARMLRAGDLRNG